ncbi:cytochrome c, class I [Isorropodon fossajaponicum endosymbiont JTNG4]|uniref:c-type cytochrome n=1 Tax=Isorropodon fossajaponicum symbiont TaxID=883811 RepID=UPI001914DB54|nr:cytochrome c5 family protein [Isorropodon fossajaponicum symbiont]BBB24448.1 cytochrome c, class I [Isorropodon fossajaponicum endosymbiont JTNG4]
MYFKNSVAAIIAIFIIIIGVDAFFSHLIKVNSVDTSTFEDRIRPLGQVYLEGDIDVNAIKAPVAVATKSRSGEEVYTSVCASCHSIGVAGAPKFGVKADWAPRIKRGIADLVKVSISGVGAMPPKGTCMTCSDDELKAAIEHMTK